VMRGHLPAAYPRRTPGLQRVPRSPQREVFRAWLTDRSAAASRSGLVEPIEAGPVGRRAEEVQVPVRRRDRLMPHPGLHGSRVNAAGEPEAQRHGMHDVEGDDLSGPPDIGPRRHLGGQIAVRRIRSRSACRLSEKAIVSLRRADPARAPWSSATRRQQQRGPDVDGPVDNKPCRPRVWTRSASATKWCDRLGRTRPQHEGLITALTIRLTGDLLARKFARGGESLRPV